MPLLARVKRRVGRQLGSQALQADATETALCVWLSAILLAGLGLNALVGSSGAAPKTSPFASCRQRGARPRDHRPLPGPPPAGAGRLPGRALKLCAAAGLVRLGLVALDDTKVAANAADRASRTLAKLEEEVTQILREAAATDQAEDSPLTH
jgi:hypothetical protein